MKIIQVIPFLGLGGAETMCENLVYELVKMGHEVKIISLYYKETAITQRIEACGIEIIYLHKKGGLDISLLKKLYEVFKYEKPDVIHTHIYTAKYVFPIATKLRIKVVHTVHSIATKELSPFWRRFNKYFFKKFDVVPVALSENIKKTILDEYKFDENSVPVVLNGIDLSKCRVKENYGIKGNFKIVHVGSFLEVKNHIGLIDAFEIFHSKYQDSELHLIGDGERRPLIEQMVKEKNLSEAVVFHGLQSNVHAFLHDMDVFTLPSLYEGIPMTLIEAMGTGLPIVATKVGGIPDMLVDEENALLVENECSTISVAYEKYFRYADLREKHGKKAREVSPKFSSYNMACEYEKLYLS